MRGSSRPPEAVGVQNAVFTAQQARDAGYSAKQARHRLRSGQWTVVLGSVYADRSALLTPVSLARAAALAAGTSAVVSHVTGAVLCDLKAPRDPEAHVIVDPERRLRIAGLRPHRLALAESEIMVVDGIPCTSVIRTLVDCLLWLPEEAGRAMAVDALRRGRVSVDELRTALRRAGQRHGLSRAWSVRRRRCWRALGSRGAGPPPLPPRRCWRLDGEHARVRWRRPDRDRRRPVRWGAGHRGDRRACVPLRRQRIPARPHETEPTDRRRIPCAAFHLGRRRSTAGHDRCHGAPSPRRARIRLPATRAGSLIVFKIATCGRVGALEGR
jgi:hypothetical protein